jgi:hypothetical protein
VLAVIPRRPREFFLLLPAIVRLVRSHYDHGQLCDCLDEWEETR